MSLINQFNSTCLSFFNFLTESSKNVTNTYIRDYITNCYLNNESTLVDQFVINILPYIQNVKDRDLKFLLSPDLCKLFQNKIKISSYLNEDNKELIFSYLELLCNMSIEYLKVTKLV